LSATDKYAGLPHIEPDPNLQLISWKNSGTVKFNPQQAQYYASVRRAFIQAMVARYHISTAEELREVVRRRFGAKPGIDTVISDMKLLGIIRVPVPGGGTRLKLISQLNNVNLEQEIDERFRIDALGVRRQGSMIIIEVNRGTATAFVQLMNLVVDENTRGGLIAVTTDNDKWVVLHIEDSVTATSWTSWLTDKLY
jgi:arginine repressor